MKKSNFLAVLSIFTTLLVCSCSPSTSSSGSEFSYEPISGSSVSGYNFDLNEKYSFRYLKEKNYMNVIIDKMEKLTPVITPIFEKIRDFITKKLINFNYEFDYVVIGYDHENNNLLIYEYYFQK